MSARHFLLDNVLCAMAILIPVPGVAVFADDHLVFGCANTMEEACKSHDNNFCGLLETARKIGLESSSAKIWFQHEEVHYLGHWITGDGLRPDSEMVATIMKMQKASEVKSWQQFIGL